MEWRGVKRLRAIAGVLCVAAGVGYGASAAAALLPNLSSGSSQDAREAADLADANADSPVQRALSTMPIKAPAEKASAEKAPDTAAKPANAASASKPEPRPLGETLHNAAKDLAVSSGAVEAKQYLSTEFGPDRSANADADADANLMRRRASTGGDTAATNSAPPRSAEQMKLDEEQASFLASALVREVMPWAIGAAVLLGCAQGLRALLALSRRQTVRKRKYRRSSSSASRKTRM